ncbi:MAG TPA: lipopolysaccharide transport periplasmic protein LptA [Methylomirabilota bacterium]|nr:lipopolysaccharide transport periplasmic protein LptA [Methylomirabilota bacterium]
MTRRLVVGALAVWAAVSLAAPAWAQSATPRPRPARPSSTAPAPRPDGAADGRNAPVTVDADQLENIQKEGLVVFTGNVVATQNSSTQWADRMEVYLDDKGDRIVRTISTGNVRIITRDCRSGTAKRAEYYDAEQRVVLIGNARVWRDDNVVTGERITIFLAEDRSVVEGGQQERVKAVFYPKSQDEAAARPKPVAGQCS